MSPAGSKRSGKTRAHKCTGRQRCKSEMIHTQPDPASISGITPSQQLQLCYSNCVGGFFSLQTGLALAWRYKLPENRYWAAPDLKVSAGRVASSWTKKPRMTESWTCRFLAHNTPENALKNAVETAFSGMANQVFAKRKKRLEDINEHVIHWSCTDHTLIIHWSYIDHTLIIHWSYVPFRSLPFHSLFRPQFTSLCLKLLQLPKELLDDWSVSNQFSGESRVVTICYKY